MAKAKNKMRILSLFDGISCARVALERAGIPVELYFAFEIDKYAIQISANNYPSVLRGGSVVGADFRNTDMKYDLLIGGSPCQDLSIAKRNRKGLDGERSGLFWEYVRILNEVKPKYFILENVNSMPKEAKDLITKTLGVEPIMINASLVSAQSRKRLFWTNIPNVTLPGDKGIILKDILESGDVDRLKSYCIDASYYKGANWKQYKEKGRRQLVVATLDEGTWAKRFEQIRRVYGEDGLAPTLPTGTGGGVIPKIYVPEGTKKGYAVATEGQSIDLSFPNSKTRRGRVGNKAKNIMTSQNIGVFTGGVIRKLTPIECERLQGLPDNYTKYGADIKAKDITDKNPEHKNAFVEISNTQRYKCLGNAFNVDVITHILKHIPNGN